MIQFIPLVVGLVALAVGAVLGYYARQSIAKKKEKSALIGADFFMGDFCYNTVKTKKWHCFLA